MTESELTDRGVDDAAAERAARHLDRVHRLAGLFAAARTVDEAARIVVDEATAALGATTAIVYGARDDGRLEHLASRGVHSTILAAYPTLGPDDAVPVARVFRDGTSEWLDSEDAIAERYPQFASAVRNLEGAVGRLVAVPLAIGERRIGAVSFRFTGSRPIAVDERALVVAIAAQASQSLDRIALFESGRRVRRRLELLNELAAALSKAQVRNDVSSIVVDRGLRATGADTCTLYTYDERSKKLMLIADRGISPAILDRIRIIDETSPVFAPFLAGETLWAQNEEDYDARVPSLARARTPGPRARAFFSAPMIAEGKPIGLVGMGFYAPHTFSDDDRAFIEIFVQHCAEALLRAQRLQSERAARTAAERLRGSLETTLRSIGDAVICTDASGRVTLMNPVAEGLTGWPEDEARGQPLAEVFHIINEQSREEVESPVDKVLREGVVVGLANHTVLVGRRRETPIDDSGAPIRGDDGSIDGVVLVFRDISAKKLEETRRAFIVQASELLAESLDYEATLARVAQLAVPTLADWSSVEIVEEGVRVPKRLVVAHSDPTRVELARTLNTRYPMDPDSPTGVANVLRTGRSEMYPHIDDAMLEHGARDADHLRIMRELQLRSALIVPLVARGRVLGVISFVHAESGRNYSEDDRRFAEDLARRCAIAIDNARLYAAERRARESADVANRAKDEFLATVSHELRTPLNAILGWARMLSSVLEGSKRERAIATIERNAVAMAQLVEDLLDVSRIIGGKMRLDTQPVDLARVADAAVESVRPAADAKGIAILTSLDPSSGSIVGDPTRLQQVIWNLLSNAVKFTPKGGRVEVALRGLESTVELTVIDNGKGIEAQFLPHVFDPFRQQEASYTRSRGGLGLGLTITRHLVELHGGRIDVHSEGEGRGATFAVHLPKATETPADAPPDKRPRPRLPQPPRVNDLPSPIQGMRVLVVDDDEDARQLIRTVLEQHGAQVTTAADADSALAELDRRVPDVILSDIGMPGKDGYELIRSVRSLPVDRGGAIPAAALTAYARSEDRLQALHAGYSMHISKPVDPAELVAVVATLTRFSTPHAGGPAT